MNGKLYVVGVGPGDPELLTLKALRIIRECPCLCVPRGKQEGESLALSIVAGVLPLEDKEIIAAYFPMRKTRGTTGGVVPEETGELLKRQWRETTALIHDRISRGVDVAFLTLGDPGLYSTFYYLHELLSDSVRGLEIEVVPGIPSFCAAAARATTPLGLADDRIAILPANYHGDLAEMVARFETVILLKVHQSLEAVRRILHGLDPPPGVIYVGRVGLQGEMIIRGLDRIGEEKGDYFSLLIIRRQEDRK